MPKISPSAVGPLPAPVPPKGSSNTVGAFIGGLLLGVAATWLALGYFGTSQNNGAVPLAKQDAQQPANPPLGKKELPQPQGTILALKGTSFTMSAYSADKVGEREVLIGSSTALFTKEPRDRAEYDAAVAAFNSVTAAQKATASPPEAFATKTLRFSDLKAGMEVALTLAEGDADKKSVTPLKVEVLSVLNPAGELPPPKLPDGAIAPPPTASGAAPIVPPTAPPAQ